MNKYKILITGGAGFIGSHVADEYIKNGHSIVIIDNLSNGKEKNINNKAKFYKGDILDRNFLETIFQKEKIEIISHHAASINILDSIENSYNNVMNNVIGSINLIDLAKKHAIKKIIFASSGGAINSYPEKIPTPNNAKPTPLSPYGVSKRSVELFLESLEKTHNIPFISLRYSNVYGSRQSSSKAGGVVSIFLKKMINKSSPLIYNQGKDSRDYIFIKDVVNANLIALNTAKSGIYNIATSQETTTLELFNLIQEILKTKIKPNFKNKKTIEQKRSCLKIDNTPKKLKWKPTYDLKNGIFDILRN